MEYRSTGTLTNTAGTCPEPTSRSSRPTGSAETRPDLVLVLPWNLRDEIVQQLAYVREWGSKFVIPIPQPTVI